MLWIFVSSEYLVVNGLDVNMMAVTPQASLVPQMCPPSVNVSMANTWFRLFSDCARNGWEEQICVYGGVELMFALYGENAIW